jgi:CheY-like chemotaxis protein
MRPRKVVLCVDAADLRLGMRAFTLETWGYRAVKAASCKAAAGMLQEGLAPDALLLQAPIAGAVGALRAARARNVPSLVTSDLEFAVHDSNLAHADLVLSKGRWDAAELRERLRVMVVRKRGPKKKPAAGVGQTVGVGVGETREAVCA